MVVRINFSHIITYVYVKVKEFLAHNICVLCGCFVGILLISKLFVLTHVQCALG